MKKEIIKEFDIDKIKEEKDMAVYCYFCRRSFMVPLFIHAVRTAFCYLYCRHEDRTDI